MQGLFWRAVGRGNPNAVMTWDRQPPGESRPGETPHVLPYRERLDAEAPSKAKPGEATLRVRGTPRAHSEGRKARGSGKPSRPYEGWALSRRGEGVRQMTEGCPATGGY